ncbi:hypothetical protein [Actinoplanes sp. NPDC051851]|uniref:hypothetical protein n=1 Tax=Actinoplanes sp. NPDC051851 TaxID=3154753 RepID=UPI00342C2716
MNITATEVRTSPVTFWGRAGALWDLVITAPFATPWTAGLVFDALRAVHRGLGLPGAEPPVFEPMMLMMVSLFGTAVLMWSLGRLWYPLPRLILTDTVGRLLFITWFAWSWASGGSAVSGFFLLLELIWAVAQAQSLYRHRRADR